MASQRAIRDTWRMTYACDEAIKLIEWLLPELSATDALAVELPFLDVSRKADLVAIGPSRLSAFEIKGPRDNFRRLADQVFDYQKMFLDVSVAVPQQHLSSAREMIPRNVGLILLGQEDATWVRRPRPRTRLKAEHAVRWLDSNDLSSLLGSTVVRVRGIDESRQLATKIHSDMELTCLALNSVAARCRDRFAAFQQEKGSIVDLDDLQLLALSGKLRVQPKRLSR